MKVNFEVKEQGYDCDASEENAEDLLEQFTNFIRKKKVPAKQENSPGQARIRGAPPPKPGKNYKI